MISTNEEKIDKFKSVANSTKRMGVSEFARSNSWRKHLPDIGCFEIIDRNGTVGYMFSPEYVKSLSEHLNKMEHEIEQAQIRAMFEARKNRDNLKTGEQLEKSALNYLDEKFDALSEVASDSF